MNPETPPYHLGEYEEEEPTLDLSQAVAGLLLAAVLLVYAAYTMGMLW